MKNNLVALNDPHFIIDMMYARKNNMIGRAVYKEIGYNNVAYMHSDVREALLKTIPFLEANKLKMRICDAYRPPIAHQKLLEIIPNTKANFFAKTPERSNHCHGTAVDVCLTDINGNNLIYPTKIDAYEEHFQKQVCEGFFKEFEAHLLKAHHNYSQATPEALKNRKQLKELMESVGFEHLPHEWWHYNIKGYQNYPLIDWQPEI